MAVRGATTASRPRPTANSSAGCEVVSASITAKASIGGLLVGLTVVVPAGAQTTAAQTTIFTTTDFRQDRDRWTDPAYYRNNTPGQLRGMAINVEGRRTGQELSARGYGSEGTGKVGSLNLNSPYPYTNALDHYQALLQAAKVGTN